MTKSKVILSKTSVKWVLDHLDIFSVCGGPAEDRHDNEICMYMLEAMWPGSMIGIVGEPSRTERGVYKVTWKIPGMKGEYSWHHVCSLTRVKGEG